MGEDISFQENLTLFVLLFVCFLVFVLWCFELCLVSIFCCSHHIVFTVMCLIKLLICFTSCLLDCIFTCYIILVLLLLALFWGSNVFCVSVSGYRNICSKFITSFRFRCEWILPLFPNSSLSIEFVKGCFVTE